MTSSKIELQQQSESQIIRKSKDHVILSKGNTFLLFEKKRLLYNNELEDQIANLQFSEDGGWILITTSREKYVLNTSDPENSFSVTENEGFLKISNDEYFVRNLSEEEIQLTSFNTSKPQFRIALKKYFIHLKYDFFHSSMIGTGYYKGESDDSIYVYKGFHLGDEPRVGFSIIDSAEIVAIGPSDSHQYVIYRDPLENENDFEKVDYEEDELLGFKGFYIPGDDEEVNKKIATPDMNKPRKIAECNHRIFSLAEQQLIVLDWDGNSIKTIENVTDFDIDYQTNELAYVAQNEVFIVDA